MFQLHLWSYILDKDALTQVGVQTIVQQKIVSVLSGEFAGRSAGGGAGAGWLCCGSRAQPLPARPGRDRVQRRLPGGVGHRRQGRPQHCEGVGTNISEQLNLKRCAERGVAGERLLAE